uniref:RRM domain-containing protein n=1 Tax=Aegilops tauschii subsp. strangulata TaxID=200361 RepID=A0A453MAS6_AEGTS
LLLILGCSEHAPEHVQFICPRTATAMTQQATRHAQRVYVGGLPPIANEQTVALFFNQVMDAIGGNTFGPGDTVVNMKLIFEFIRKHLRWHNHLTLCV